MNLKFLAVLFPTLATANASLIDVKVEIIEALSQTDTTSSFRFQKEFEQAVTVSKTALDPALKKCGYRLETTTTYFDASDPLQAKEKAEQAVAKKSWVMIGPRRSNHYLLLAQGAGSTPTISLMASATEVESLGLSHVSLSPSNKEMAAAAAVEAELHSSPEATFLQIVSDDCVSCKDFSGYFAEEAKKLGLKDLGTYKVVGEQPDMTALSKDISAKNPNIIVVPNFSKTSAHIISSLSPLTPKTLFVGADGWGDAQFGFLQNSPSVQSAQGITVRGFPPVTDGLKTFRLGRNITSKNLASPSSGPGMGLLKALDGIETILCSERPKTQEAFSKAFKKHANKQLSAPFGVSVYRLKNSNIEYERRARVK
jgi:ABC-type branched-subunit amino acid transport system substrate-binding protein